MYNSNFRHGSRAGLVALILVLFISLVSAVPIPTTESGLSKLSTSLSPSSLNGLGQTEADTAKNLLIARMSTPPIATRDLVRYRISNYLLVFTELGLPLYIRTSRLTWTINLYVANLAALLPE